MEIILRNVLYKNFEVINRRIDVVKQIRDLIDKRVGGVAKTAKNTLFPKH